MVPEDVTRFYRDVLMKDFNLFLLKNSLAARAVSIAFLKIIIRRIQVYHNIIRFIWRAILDAHG